MFKIMEMQARASHPVAFTIVHWYNTLIFAYCIFPTDVCVSKHRSPFFRAALRALKYVCETLSGNNVNFIQEKYFFSFFQISASFPVAEIL